MLYFSQRLARNDFGWQRPSPSRLGRTGEGEFVEVQGYGCEDWNFNTSLAIDGFVYGYTYYYPSEAKRDEAFNFAFVTHEASQWHLVGFYFDAHFVPGGAPADRRVVAEKASHLRALGNSLGPKIRRLPDDGLRRYVAREDQAASRWRVAAKNVVSLSRPRLLPSSLFDSQHYRITKPSSLRPDQFRRLHRFSQDELGAQLLGDDMAIQQAFSEGRLATAVHLRRERSPTLTRVAKQSFKDKHGRLFCEACGFDFHSFYGDCASEFIEAHHTVPVAQLDGATSVRPEDLAMLCSNCHRVVHINEPWMTVEELRAVVAGRKLRTGSG